MSLYDSHWAEKARDSNGVMAQLSCSKGIVSTEGVRRRNGWAGHLSVAVKSTAVKFQPVSGLPNVFCELTNDVPKLRGMIHLHQMRSFMSHNIIENIVRGHDQPPVERKATRR